MTHVEILRANLGNLPAKDRDFATSLLAGVAKYGRPTEKQAVWIERLAKRATGQEPTREEVGDLSGLRALFDSAKGAGLKKPKLRFAVEGLTFAASPAGDNSANPGALYIKSRDVGYLGKVTREGVWSPLGSIEVETATAIGRALKAMAQDPDGAARAYGKLTSSCCFCGLELSDDRSIAAGYGPICAAKWGLAWGEKPAKGRKAA